MASNPCSPDDVGCTNFEAGIESGLRSQTTDGSIDLHNVTGSIYRYHEPYITLPWHYQLIYIIAFVAMAAVAVGGNFLVILSVASLKRMHTAINYLLANLAIVDVIYSAFYSAFYIFYMVDNDWPYGRNYCRFLLFLSPLATSMRMYTLLALAVERYMAVVYSGMNTMVVLVIIVCTWVASILIALPSCIYAGIHSWIAGNNQAKISCSVDWHELSSRIVSVVAQWCDLFLPFVTYVILLISLIVMYTLIRRRVWNNQIVDERTAGTGENISSQRQIVRMMISMVIIYAVCWLPHHVYFIVSPIVRQLLYFRYTRHVYLIIRWISMSNSMFFPILYFSMSSSFRHGLKYLFRWLPCIRYVPDSESSETGGERTENVRMVDISDVRK